MKMADTPKTAGEMLADIMGNVSNLVRNEADLARAEIAESTRKAMASIGAMALALALAITALNMLAAALVALVIRAGLPPHWASAAAGTGLLIVAIVLFSFAKSALLRIGFVPSRAVRSVQRDVSAIKESINDE
jgi:hypothetical protein